ncbi:MAG: glucoamylase family protein [Elusimicrobiota bacterium]
MKNCILCLLVPCMLVSSIAVAAIKQELSQDDQAYLLGIAKDTWASIDYLVEPKTGLPYDISRKKPTYTSVSNIGIYLAAVSIAVEMNFINRNDAVQRVSKALDSVEKFPVWNGFTQSWHDVLTLQPNTEDTWISILDSGNLAAGFIVARQEFPELKNRISKLLEAMDWSKVYNAKRQLMIGGYDMKAGKLNNNWLLNVMGTDARAAFITAIGSGKVPPEMWKKISKGMEIKYGVKYYKPGWMGGGLFMQLIDSCFFDMRYTELWKSAAAFTYAQMFHAKVINSPIWGWSASDSPNEGYLGINRLRDYVATPHASVLPISIFPEESVANLKKLEELGARQEYEADGKKYAFGFRDSIDFVKGQPTNTYLILDQGMLFLSLCNYLSGGKIWELSNRDPIIKNARKLIPDLRPNKKDYEEFISKLYSKNMYVSCKSVYSNMEYRAGDTVKCDISVICDDPDVSGEYNVMWRLFYKKTGEKLKSGSKTINISKGTRQTVESFEITVDEGEYLLQAVIRGKDGSEPARDKYEFRVSYYLELAGKCFFKTGDDMAWAKFKYDDGEWAKIDVPARWDDQGYPSKDNSYQWYRIHAYIPAEAKDRWNESEVYFTAGGIDDGEQVYYNGELIGSTAFPPNFKEGFWDKERNYKIPAKLIKYGGDNVIAVRAYNYIREGGIWKGPVRIIHKQLAGSSVSFAAPSW